MKKSFSQKYRAFSFTELMVVITIIGVMSAVLFASLTSNRSASRLKTAQREVASTIKLAQTYALQGKKQGSVTPCGYGFRFSTNTSYQIFYNPPGPGPQDCAWKNDRWQDRQWQNVGQTPPAETFTLKNGVTLYTTFTPIADTEIYFAIPHANMYNKDGNAYPAAQIFRFDFSGNRRDITVNPGGYVTEN